MFAVFITAVAAAGTSQAANPLDRFFRPRAPRVDATPTPTPMPTPTPPNGELVERPSEVLSTGFFVKDGEIYDPEGRRFLMRGLNHTHWFGDQQANLAAVDELPATGVNIVRAVFGPGFGVDTPEEKREVVQRYAQNQLPVMVEDHRGTCDTDPATLDAIVDDWTQPDNVAWLNDYERSVVLNIANEWGSEDADVWATSYQQAVQRIRAAGIHNMIVIDSGGGCGQHPGPLLTRGQDVLASDPEHNVAFSLHMYGFWRTSEATDVDSWGSAGAPWSIRERMTALKSAGLPIIVGEMAWEDCDQVGYQTREALQIFDELGIGWLAWSWNQNADATYDLRAGSTAYTYDGPADLTEGGRMFLLDPDYGVQATAVPASGLE